MKLDDISEEDQILLAGEILVKLADRGINSLTLTMDDDSVIKVYILQKEES